jgi:hypothetical protein
MRKLLTAFAVLLLISTPCLADDGSVQKPSVSTSQTTVVTAVVEAINHETRALTLRGPEGEVHSFVIGEEAVNLDQVNIGDTVVAEYVQSMDIEVIDGEGMEPVAGEAVLVERAEKGAAPGMVAVDAVVVTATLVEINLEEGTFKLQGPEGNINEFAAIDPANLLLVEVGDLVVMTFTESVGISVEKSTIE